MFMNIVAIDPSLISTALVVNGKMINYCRESKVYGKTGMSKWFKLDEIPHNLYGSHPFLIDKAITGHF